MKNVNFRTEFPAETKHLAEIKKYIDSTPTRHDSVFASVYPLVGKVNQSGAEFNPIVNGDGFLYGSQQMDKVKYFASKKIDRSKMPATRAIFQAYAHDEVIDSIGPFSLSIPNMEISSFTFDLQKRIIYITACHYDERFQRYLCNIYRSKLKDDVWSNPKLVEELATEKYTTTHVNMGYDAGRKAEIIYFSSDREGSRGGLDIWYSYYNARLQTFAPPRNLGANINTLSDEITPFYHIPTNTLYFSSNGRGGLGGFDIYNSKWLQGSFRTVETFGAEVNSSEDDVFFSPNMQVSKGYFVSNRYSENSLLNPHCCDDIFFFDKSFREKKRPKLIVQVRNRKTQKPIPNFQYSLLNLDSVDASLISNGNAKDSLLLDDIPKRKMEIEIVAKGYFRKKGYLEITQDSTYIPIIELDTIDYRPILLPLVEFDFDSFSLTPISKHIIDSLVVPVLKENPTLTIELSAHTDSRGSDIYNEELSAKRAKAIYIYLITAFNITPERLRHKGYGEYAPIAPNENADGSDNPAGRQQNRRCEFKILKEEYDPF